MQQSQRSRSHSINSRNREALLIMTASAALLAGLTTSIEALPFNQQPVGQSEAWPPAKAKAKGKALTARDKASAKPESEDLAAKANGVLAVVISIDKQQLTLYSDGHPIAHSRVSTGVPGHPTPTGVFSIIEKDRWHRSNIYYNAPMFYMQRITWSGVAMHQGVVPNGPASHGCIRLPGAFARQIWGITKLGVRVIVTHSGEVTPVAITDERLFSIKLPKPKSEPEATPMESTDTSNGGPGSTSLTAKGDTTATDAIKSGRPALDAMAYAPGAPRKTAATDAETVKSNSRRARPAQAPRRQSRRDHGQREHQAAQARPDLRVHQSQGRQAVLAQGLRAGVRRAGDVRAAGPAARHPCIYRFRRQRRQHDAALERDVHAGRGIGAGEEAGKEVGEGEEGGSPSSAGARIQRSRCAQPRGNPAGSARSDFPVDVARRLANHL